jgi:uncharacterized membrane protein
MQTTTTSKLNRSIDSPERSRRGPGLASQRVPTPTPRSQNVGQAERIVSTLLGGALLLSTLRRPSLTRAPLALGAGALLHRGVTGHCYAYRALGVNTARDGSRERAKPEKSITIEKPVEELYRAWRDPQHVALLVGDFARIEALPDGRWRWRARLPAGKTLEWTTRTVEDRPNESITWRTEPDAPVQHEGSVRFRPAPQDWGTVVTLRMSFGAAGGPLATLTGQLLPRIPKALEESILRRCKSLCISGEIATLDKNPSARTPARAASPRPLPRS